MMNMDVMRRLVAEAETGDCAMPTAHAALSHWDFDSGTLKDLRYSANAIYTFRQYGAPRILRLSHAGDGVHARTRAHIEAELDFILYLKKQGIEAMSPLPSKSGAYVEIIDSPYAHFHAAVFERAPGDLFLQHDKLSEAQLAAWGRTVATVHNAAEAYVAPSAHRRPGWQEIVDMVTAWLPAQEHNARRFLQEAEAWLAGLPTGPEDYGLIHWDFCIDNLAWEEEEPQTGRYHIFDFDDAAYFWYVADLAFALDDVLDMPPAQRDRMMDTFLSGYRAIRPAISPWLDEIPRFVKFMYIFKVARVMHALAPANPALDPPWMAKLRIKFEKWFAEMRELFADTFITTQPTR